jgi:hypothetical protein
MMEAIERYSFLLSYSLRSPDSAASAGPHRIAAGTAVHTSPAASKQVALHEAVEHVALAYLCRENIQEIWALNRTLCVQRSLPARS